MKRLTIILTLVAIVTTTSIAFAGSACCSTKAPSESASTDGHTEGTSVFSSLAGQYLIIQHQLASDSLDDVQEAALVMVSLAQDVNGLDAVSLGISADQSTAAGPLLAETANAAELISGARDIVQARAAFANLSSAMVGLRDMAEGERPSVAYCSMAKKSWLQNGKKIANPYYGASMLRCGTFVKD